MWCHLPVSVCSGLSLVPFCLRFPAYRFNARATMQMATTYSGFARRKLPPIESPSWGLVYSGMYPSKQANHTCPLGLSNRTKNVGIL